MKPDEIRNLRYDLLLNRAEFGKLFGVSYRTVEAWEQGLRVPGPSVDVLLLQIQRRLLYSEPD